VLSAGQEELDGDALAADHVCRSEAPPCDMAVGDVAGTESGDWRVPAGSNHDAGDDDADPSMTAEGDGWRWTAVDGDAAQCVGAWVRVG
jgi:hypothetical protein